MTGSTSIAPVSCGSAGSGATRAELLRGGCCNAGRETAEDVRADAGADGGSDAGADSGGDCIVSAPMGTLLHRGHVGSLRVLVLSWPRSHESMQET